MTRDSSTNGREKCTLVGQDSTLTNIMVNKPVLVFPFQSRPKIVPRSWVVRCVSINQVGHHPLYKGKGLLLFFN